MYSLKKILQSAGSSEKDKTEKDKAEKDKTKTSSDSKEGKNIEVINTTLNIIHYLIKFLPLGFYFFAYFSATIYKDIKSALLLIGLIINDIIGYLWKKYTKGINNPNCNMFSSINSDTDKDSNKKSSQSGGSENNDGNGEVNNFYGDFMQNPHVEIVSFVTSFFGTDMFYKQKLDIVPFIFLSITLFLTVWSMMSIKCEKKISNVITNIIYQSMINKHVI